MKASQIFNIKKNKDINKCLQSVHTGVFMKDTGKTKTFNGETFKIMIHPLFQSKFYFNPDTGNIYAANWIKLKP